MHRYIFPTFKWKSFSPPEIAVPYCSFILALLCTGNLLASSLTSGALSISELTARSDIIAIGTVSSITSDWNPNKSIIETRIDLKVEAILKWTVAQNRIIFYQLGGVVADTASSVGETARFDENERVTVFLSRNNQQRLQLVGSFQGKFSVERRAQGEVAVRRVPGLNKPLDEIPFDDFKMQIQKASTR
jgi:hypothetical protein